MNKYRIAICDDEQMARDIVKSAVISAINSAQATAEIDICSSTSELEEKMKSKTFDLLLLDIGMQPESGLKFANRLRKTNNQVDIIFISSFIDKVFDTFSAQPFAFVRKTRFMEDIELALKRWLESPKRSDVAQNGLLLKTKNGVGFFSTNDIISIEGKKNKQLITVSGKDDISEVYDSLQHIEEMLEGQGFLRVQKSFIINFAFVKEIITDEVVLSNGIHIPIGRGRTREVKKAYIDWLSDGNMML